MMNHSPHSIVSIQGLSINFGGVEALKGVNLEIPAGTVFALLGENGAGKTSLIRVLTGFLRPHAGQVEVLGLSPLTQSMELRRRIGYVSDAPALYEWMRVGEIGWFASSFYPPGFLEKYRELIGHYQVSESQKIKSLSKGQRAKVALALALAHDPDLLILDEPTSGLDPLVRREFLESMVDRVASGKTVLLSSHQISEVERITNHVVFLHQGSVKLVDSLANLRESITEVTLSLSDSLASIPLIPSTSTVLSDVAIGRQRRLVLTNFGEQEAQILQESPTVLKLNQRPIGLEDLFAACTRGSGQIELRNQEFNAEFIAR